MSYHLGLDLGTTSVKACAFSTDGKMLEECQEAYELNETAGGAAEQAPEEVLSAAERALASLIKKLGEPPLGIGISAAMHSVILLDEHHQPLTQVITWADTRASVDQFSEAEKKKLLRRTGTPVHPMSPLVKLNFLADEFPSVWSQTKYVSDLKSLIVHRWTTDGLLIDTNLASATGLYNLEEQTWDEAALVIARIEQEQLPIVVVPTTRLNWRPEIAEKMGLPSETPLFIGGSDGCLANLGSGLLKPGEVALTIGTSGATRTTHRSPTIDPELGLFNYHLIDDLYVMGGASNNGGKLLEWCHEFFGNHFESISKMLEAAKDADCDGLVFEPYLYGERAPIYDATATASFKGMRGHHRPEQYARAVIEGITDNMVRIIQDVEAGSQKAERIVASGGFTRSDWWVELFEKESGRKVVVAETPQASAYGAALMARIGLGEIGLDDLNSTRPGD